MLCVVYHVYRDPRSPPFTKHTCSMDIIPAAATRESVRVDLPACCNLLNGMSGRSAACCLFQFMHRHKTHRDRRGQSRTCCGCCGACPSEHGSAVSMKGIASDWFPHAVFGPAQRQITMLTSSIVNFTCKVETRKREPRKFVFYTRAMRKPHGGSTYKRCY